MGIVTELDGDLGKLRGIETEGEERAEVGPSGFRTMVFENGDGGGDGGFMVG